MPFVLFSPGIVVLATADALQAMQYNEVTPQRLMWRHLAGDWGELPLHARRANDRQAAAGSGNIVSRYRLDDGELVLVSTDFAAASTVISQPGDDRELRRCITGWRGSLHHIIPPMVPHFMVPIDLTPFPAPVP